MTVVHFSEAVANSMGAQVIAALDAGSGPARVRFYTAPMAASVNEAITTQTLLGTLTCSDPSADTAAGILTFAAIAQDASADSAGQAAWARVESSAGTAVVDLDVTGLAGSGAIKLNTVEIIAGGPILLNSLAIDLRG